MPAQSKLIYIGKQHTINIHLYYLNRLSGFPNLSGIVELKGIFSLVLAEKKCKTLQKKHSLLCMVYISRVRDGSYQFPSCSRLQSGCSSTSFSFKEVLPFYISGAISQMRNISLLEIKFVVPHTSPSYSNNTLGVIHK